MAPCSSHPKGHPTPSRNRPLPENSANLQQNNQDSRQQRQRKCTHTHNSSAATPIGSNVPSRGDVPRSQSVKSRSWNSRPVRRRGVCLPSQKQTCLEWETNPSMWVREKLWLRTLVFWLFEFSLWGAGATSRLARVVTFSVSWLPAALC